MTPTEILLEDMRRERASMDNDSPEASFADLFIAKLQDELYKQGVGETATLSWDDFQAKGMVNVS